MNFPNWREWLYSFKAFAAAMLALYISFYLSLPNPYWAVATVYIVSHPLSGATRSKAVYRVMGTIIGATASVVLVPAFVNSPMELCVVTALWTATLLYLSLLNRTPSSYVLLLSAYTMPLISLPTVVHPEQIYDVALARTEEILVGITCASLVSMLVFPTRITTVLGAQMGRLLNDGGIWAEALLAPRSADAAPSSAMRTRLMGDIVSMDALIKQLFYDTTNRVQAEHAGQIRLRMTMLIPQASSLSEPLQALHRRNPPLAAKLFQLVDNTVAWMREGLRSSPQTPVHLREQVGLQKAELTAHGIDEMLAGNALLRLSELIDLWQDCISLRRAYDQTDRDITPSLIYRTRQKIGGAHHFDQGLLFFASCSTAAAMIVASLLWIASGWQAGAGGLLLVAVTSCFFATVDNPSPQLNAFMMWGVVVGNVFALIYLFALLPHVVTFLGVAGVLALPLLVAGTFTGRPQHAMAVLLFTSQAITDLGLRNGYSSDFESFANSGLSAMLGIIFAMVWSTITKPFGTELVARRLARAMWQDMAMLARSQQSLDQAALASRMIDRTTQLLPRIALVKDEALARLDAVRGLRIGLRLLDLQTHREALTWADTKALNAMLSEIGDYFDRCAAQSRPLTPPAPLRIRLDEAINVLMQQNDEPARYTAQALIGLRLALFHALAGEHPEPATGSLLPSHTPNLN